MSLPTQPPKDALGNELHEADIVTLVTDKPLFFRVMKIDNGGIQTPQGMTPAVVVLGVTLTLRLVPGVAILNVAKVVAPGNDALLKKLLEEPS
jgi:hypothetical protein